MDNTEKVGIIGKIKKSNRKAIMSSLTIIVVAILIVVSSLVNAGLNPEYWSSDEFIGNLMLTLSICLVGIMSGNAEGDNYYRTKKGWLYEISYNKYISLRDKIDPFIDKFPHWSENLYKRELEKKSLHYLRNDYGCKQAKLLMKLDKTQIVKLKEPQKFIVEGKECYFNSLTKEQINACLDVVSGKVRLQYINDNFWLNAFDSNKHQGKYEQASKADYVKNKKFFGLTFYRMSTTIIVGLILGALVVNANDQANTSQLVVTMISRLWTLMNSVMWGFYTANDILKEECGFLDYKTTVLNTFYLEVVVNKTFKAKTQEDIAREKIEQAEKLQKEKQEKEEKVLNEAKGE